MTTVSPVEITPVADPVDRSFDGCLVPDSAADPYEALLFRLKRQHVPFTVLWELTHVCNLDCIMCYNVPLDKPELDTGECLDVLDQLAEAGTLRLTLTGGEVLARRDCFAIAERARALGFDVNLKTNGTLITPERAERIAALTPSRVDISLLGATAATFDAIARGEDTLRRVLRGVQLLQERRVPVKLNTLLMDLNITERQQMIELAQELGVRYEQVFKISTADDGTDKAGQHQLDRQQITAAMLADGGQFKPRMRQPESRTCSVGLSSCLISPYGDVYPCLELRIPAGNLRQQRFRDIWANAPILQELRARHTFESLPECQVCPINAYCEGRCSGLAWKEHGDLYGGHSLACQQAQARFDQLHPGESIPETPLQARLRANPPAAKSTPFTQPIPLLAGIDGFAVPMNG